jgi:predicted phosphodiesterase
MKDRAVIHRIEHESRADIIKIKPIMDLHYGSSTCDVKAFREYLRDRDEFTWFVTNGDLMDSILFNDKRYQRSMDASDKEIDEVIDADVLAVYKILEPIKDRILAVGHGNHEQTIVKKCGTNPSKRLAEMLGAPYMGYSYWMRLIICRKATHKRAVDFMISHGFGGGTRTEGGSLTKYSKAADRFDADVLIYGHDHKKNFTRYPVLYIDQSVKAKLIAKPKLVCLGGSWKKTYTNNTSASWEECMGFPPSEVGGITIEIKHQEQGVGLSVKL